MPRIVNHDQRRAELAKAVWSLIREAGMAGVTIRKLSEQSGWSSGAIRHYLPNREAILDFAAEQVNAAVEARLRGIVLTQDDRQNLLNLLYATMPLDHEARIWMEVWLAFVGAAVSNSNFADTQGILYSKLHQVFVDIFEEFQRVGWHLHLSPSEAAVSIHALIDGLSVHLLLHQITPEQAKTAVTQALDRMLSRPDPLV